jgi:hypothetical protein
MFWRPFQHKSIKFGKPAHCGQDHTAYHLDRTRRDHEFHAFERDAVGRRG